MNHNGFCEKCGMSFMVCKCGEIEPYSTPSFSICHRCGKVDCRCYCGLSYKIEPPKVKMPDPYNLYNSRNDPDDYRESQRRQAEERKKSNDAHFADLERRRNQRDLWYGGTFLAP